MPSSAANEFPREVIYRGLKLSEPDIRKVAFTESPPPGYTFIAAGNPELTTAMKDFASRGDHKIFVVTVSPFTECRPLVHRH
jgi:hypothetical protein